jgi:serine/threonine protein kinase
MEKFSHESKIKYTKFKSWTLKDKIENKGFYNTYRVTKVENNKKITTILKIITMPNERLTEYAKQNNKLKKGKENTNYFESIVNLIENNIKKILNLSKNENLLKILDYEVVKSKDSTSWDIYIQLEDLKLLKENYNLKEISNKQIITIGTQICKAIVLLHSENIIHCNIKEDSVYVSDKGEYKLGNYDFEYEIKNVIDEKSVNSMPHLPPENFNKGKYNKKTDIYSFGLYLYKLMNVGRIPFLTYYPSEINVDDILNANSVRMKDIPFPKPLRATKEVADIIIKACSYNAESRYKTINDMYIELEKVLTNKTYGENDLKTDLEKLSEKSKLLNENLNNIKNFKEGKVKKKQTQKNSSFKNSIPTSNSIDYSNSEITLLMDDSKSENSLSYLGNVIKESSFKKFSKSKDNFKSYFQEKSTFKRKILLIPIAVFIFSIIFLILYKVDNYENTTGTLLYENNIIKSEVSGTIDTLNFEENNSVKKDDSLIEISTKNEELVTIENSIKEQEKNLTYYDKEIESIDSGENLFDKDDEGEAEYYENFDSFEKNVQKSLGDIIKNNETPKELLERLNEELSEADLYLNSLNSGENLIESSDNVYYIRFEEYQESIKNLEGDDLKEAETKEIKKIKNEISEKIDEIVELKKQLKIHDDYYKELVNARIDKANEKIEELETKKDNNDYPTEIYKIESSTNGELKLIGDFKQGDKINEGDEIFEIIPDEYKMTTDIKLNKDVKSGQYFDFEILDSNKNIESKISNVKETDNGISLELTVDKDKLGIESLKEDKKYKIKYLSGRESLLFSLF